MAWIQSRKLWAFCLCVTATVFLLVTLQVVVELGKFERKKFKDSSFQDGHKNVEEKPTDLSPFPQEALALHEKNILDVGSYPIMLWWSPLTGETGRLGQCGADTCFFTINRSLQHHPMTKAFLFYDDGEYWRDPRSISTRKDSQKLSMRCVSARKKEKKEAAHQLRLRQPREIFIPPAGRPWPNAVSGCLQCYRNCSLSRPTTSQGTAEASWTRP